MDEARCVGKTLTLTLTLTPTQIGQRDEVRFSIEHGMSVRRIGEGPELVWIHGMGESSESFTACANAMPGRTHVLVDLPGCGRSPWSEPIELGELAEQLAAWLAERPPAFVIGHSLGGVLAQLVAERGGVRGIVDVEGNVSAGDCTYSLRIAAQPVGDFVARGFGEFRDLIFGQASTSAGERLYHAALTFASPRAMHRHACDLVALSSTGELAPRLARLRVPVLYIAGVPDGICARSRELLAEHRVRWLPIEPAGHWVYVDQQAAFVTAVQAFLRDE